MTTPVHSLDQPQGKKRSRRFYWAWGISIACLVTLAWLCWAVVVPLLQIRFALARRHAAMVDGKAPDSEKVLIEKLGGNEHAFRKFSLYLRAPRWATSRCDMAVSVVASAGLPKAKLKPLLLDAIAHPDARTRACAAGYLGRTGIRDKDIVSALARTTADKDRVVREVACMALGRIGPEASDAIPALCITLRDTARLVRMAAAAALMRIGPSDADTLKALLACLSDREEIVRRPAIKSLGWYCRGNLAVKMLPGLQKALRDESCTIRCHEAKLLGCIGQRASATVPDLEKCLEDTDQNVREYAAEAVERIKGNQETTR